MVVAALLVLIPTVFVTTITSAVLFGWVMVGYWVLDRMGWMEKNPRLSEQLQQRQLLLQRRQKQQESFVRADGQQKHHQQHQQQARQSISDPHGNHKDNARRSHRHVDATGEIEANKSNDNPHAATKQDFINEDKGEQEEHNSSEGEAPSTGQPMATSKAHGETSHHPDPVRVPSGTGQTDYRAVIADDGAYIEVAPGLDTVHHIAVGSG